jgi:hypothetical protein
MAAQVKIESGHGSPASWTEVSSVRFKMADDDLANTSAPLVKPTGSATTYSFEKAFRLNVTTGPSNSLTNLRFHRIGTMPTGITDAYGTRTIAQGYAAPVGSQSTIATGSVATSAGSGLLSVDNGPFSSGSTGQYGPFIYVQWAVSSSATAGTTTSVTYRWTFDES